MKKLQLLAIVLLAGFFLFHGCSEDDLEPIQASDITITVDEGQETGTSLVFINATSSDGAITYSIAAQDPSNALTINNVSGEVYVGATNAFNYEEFQSINAIIAISDGINIKNINLVININNIVEIAELLTTNLNVYENATDGDWVLITEDEYNALASNLLDVTKSGTSDAEYDFAALVTGSSVNRTIANDNGHTLPPESYLFAFKYNIQGSVAMLNNKVLLSESTINGFYGTVGNSLTTFLAEGDQYFVLKGNNHKTTSTGYLGIWFETQMGHKTVPSSDIYVYANGTGLSTTMSENGIGATFLYQGLSTTEKQWD